LRLHSPVISVQLMLLYLSSCVLTIPSRRILGKSMKSSNIFESIPRNIDAELFEDILKSPNVKIERIISKGQSSPEAGWYDQEENEWVIVIEGKAVLEFEKGGSITLNKGNYLNIPAHSKHKVSWTDPNQATIWLAIFYR
jgi:cupin 2 domain-containing protein